MSEVNNLLFRKLKSGKEYDSLIPFSACKRVYLGAGDTFFSMDHIEKFIKKHAAQTKKLAPKLKRTTVNATAQAIYNFLYNHIQYKADAADQNLRSPACTWAERTTGADCKSYSIFAGAILMNLGMKFYIRKVKQPNMLPNQFTHVYIIVPHNQKTGTLSEGYAIIDGTKHSNTEGPFLEKKDIFMDGLKHYGLNSPQLPHRTTTGQAEYYNSLLRHLRDYSVRPDILRRIRNGIQMAVSNRTTHTIQLRKDSIIINNIAYRFINIYGGVHQLPDRYLVGLGSVGDSFNDLVGKGEGKSDDLIKKGTNFFKDLVSGEIIGKAGDFFKRLINNITDFSCYGASPSAKPEGVREFGENLERWFNTQIDLLEQMDPDPAKGKTITVRFPLIGVRTMTLSFPGAINSLVKTLNTIIAHQLFHADESRARCTTEGNVRKAEIAKQARDFLEQIINTKFTQYYNVSKTTVNYKASNDTVPSSVDTTNWKGRSIDQTTNQYSFTLKSGSSGNLSIGDYGGGSTTPGGSSLPGQGIPSGNLPPTGSSGSSTGSSGSGSSSGGTYLDSEARAVARAQARQQQQQKMGTSLLIGAAILVAGYSAMKQTNTKK